MIRLWAFVPVAAWAFALSLKLGLRQILNVVNATLLIPLVSVPRHEAGDVVSEVDGVAIVLAWLWVSLLLVEPLKAFVAAVGRGRKLMSYSTLVLYQLVLFCDGLRSQAYEWWLWGLSLASLAQLGANANLNDLAGFRFPWVSCVASIVAGVVVFLSLPKDANVTANA